MLLKGFSSCYNQQLSGTDGSQSTGISVVRVGHEGKPDDATDSDTDDEKVPHVTLSVDSYYDEPNSIIKYGKQTKNKILTVLIKHLKLHLKT